MKRWTSMAAAAAAMMLVPGAVAAAQVTSIKLNHQVGRPENFDDVTHKSGVSRTDRNNMNFACQVNAFEIMAGQLAMRKGSSSWTRQFGEDMVREHTMAQNELKLLARQKGVRLNNNLPREMRNMLAQLERASGSRFDRLYRQMMVSSHTKAERRFGLAVRHGHDALVRGYFTKMMAGSDSHQKMARMGDVMVVRNRDSVGTAAQPMKP